MKKILLITLALALLSGCKEYTPEQMKADIEYCNKFGFGAKIYSGPFDTKPHEVVCYPDNI